MFPGSGFPEPGDKVPSPSQAKRHGWVQKGCELSPERSSAMTLAVPASLKRARRAEGTWAHIEFTHRSTASSSFVSSSQFLLPLLSPPTSKQREQHSPSSQSCWEDKFADIFETKGNNGYLLKDRNQKPKRWLKITPGPQDHHHTTREAREIFSCGPKPQEEHKGIEI